MHEVRLLGFPLALYARSQEHHEELMREFQLLALDAGSAQSVPQRLILLIDELIANYSGFTDSTNAERDAAADRGDESVDLAYVVPHSVAEACVRLDAMLVEADDFCRRGERLLTLAAPPDAAALRHWQLAEFPSQLAGNEPVPWPDFLARNPLPVGS
jgi:hypothetical protein